jgi:hypothetical protein
MASSNGLELFSEIIGDHAGDRHVGVGSDAHLASVDAERHPQATDFEGSGESGMTLCEISLVMASLWLAPLSKAHFRLDALV